MSSNRANVGPKMARDATPAPSKGDNVASSTSRRERASATVFRCLDLYSTEKSKPVSLLIHWCYGTVDRR